MLAASQYPKPCRSTVSRAAVLFACDTVAWTFLSAGGMITFGVSHIDAVIDNQYASYTTDSLKIIIVGGLFLNFALA
jgi:hypothetical protein